MSSKAEGLPEPNLRPTQEPPAIALAPWPRGVRGLLAVLTVGSAVSLGLCTWPSSYAEPRPRTEPPVLKVDPNTAPAHVLEALPQIGPSLADRIVAARQARPFASLDDLRYRVRGLGPATIARLAPYLRFDAPPEPSLASSMPEIR